MYVTLDLYRPYILVLLSFLGAWHISLCSCSDDLCLQFPLRASVSGVKSLIVSGNDGAFQFLLQNVSAPPKIANTHSFRGVSFQACLYLAKTLLMITLLSQAQSFFSSLLLKNVWTIHYHHHLTDDFESRC